MSSNPGASLRTVHWNSVRVREAFDSVRHQRRAARFPEECLVCHADMLRDGPDMRCPACLAVYHGAAAERVSFVDEETPPSARDTVVDGLLRWGRDPTDD